MKLFIFLIFTTCTLTLLPVLNGSSTISMKNNICQDGSKEIICLFFMEEMQLNTYKSILHSGHQITFLDAPVITLHPESAIRCEGTSVQLRVTATGQNIQYQWQKNGSDLPGATQNLLTLINLKFSHAGEYVCKVFNTDGTVYSNPAILEIVNPFIITVQPQSLTLQNGQTAYFSVTTSENVETYQWYKGVTPLNDGGNISGAQNQTLTVSNVSQVDQGKYFCKIIGPCNQEFSDDAFLSILSATNEVNHERHTWFPNPAKNKITFMDSDVNILSVSIYDIQGKEIYLKHDPQGNLLDISGLKPGFYTLFTITDHYISAQRLLIIR
ncbi:MAG TPA: hypothetical protein DCX89_07440 [Saprospirales bacterium]|nr:hypothetical protein [Saprospirales bacterium]HAY71710.1 hypothetical protein [Saprospirales bacterium]HRQ29862.1 immunoglobulin domain-containing protein [Saprospiraceae bacterium]